MTPPTWTKDSLKLWNADCMEVMRQFPDKHFDLAIVDPPYGLGSKVVNSGGRFARYKNENGNWDMAIPPMEYFAELGRVSARQIIWGGNYFPLPAIGGWIFWDKVRDKDVSFADGELAWTNFLTTLKKITVRYDGFIGADPERIHPTQKPIALYRALLERYATPGQRILDTHLGSGSHAIAAHYAGMDFTGIELDADYFAAACERIERETAQADMFTPPASPAPALSQPSLAL